MTNKLFLLSVLTVASFDVALADPMRMTFLDGTVRLRGSYGLMTLGANEIVKPGNWNLSHLYWRSTNVQLASGALEVDITPTWTAVLKGKIGFGGNHHIEDLDWIPPYSTDSGGPGWSHQSLHDNTVLDKYFSIDAALRYNMVEDPIGSLGILGGAKYTNVKWTAYGGTYTYSESGFRNKTGTFPDIAVGSYEQKMPIAYLGAEGTYKTGNWSLGGYGSAGIAIAPSAIDYHYLKTTKYEDEFVVAPEMTLGLSAEYRILNRLSFYADATSSWLFQLRGDTKSTNWTTGTIETFSEPAGMGAYAASISAGFKGSF